MVIYYDEDNFSIKLYRDCAKGELVGLIEVIPIDELLEVWEKHKADTPQTERKSCKLELFDDDGNYIEPQMEEGKF